MNSESVYPYPALIPGVLLRRYKRFFADIELDTGETVTAHCPNTGPMTGVCQIGAPVLLSPSNNPKRKLKFTWECIHVDGTWVGVNTGLPNRVVETGLTHDWFPEFTGFTQLKREVKYGNENSRADFLLTYPDRSIYVEVKNTTWCNGARALFPDTVTTRGQKHLRELMDVVKHGEQAVMLYFINRADCDKFSPGDDKDPTYGELLRDAVQQGVEVLPYRFAVDESGIRCLGLAQLVL